MKGILKIIIFYPLREDLEAFKGDVVLLLDFRWIGQEFKSWPSYRVVSLGHLPLASWIDQAANGTHQFC